MRLLRKFKTQTFISGETIKLLAVILLIFNRLIINITEVKLFQSLDYCLIINIYILQDYLQH
jgi:hypothetical protein